MGLGEVERLQVGEQQPRLELGAESGGLLQGELGRLGGVRVRARARARARARVRVRVRVRVSADRGRREVGCQVAHEEAVGLQGQG